MGFVISWSREWLIDWLMDWLIDWSRMIYFFRWIFSVSFAKYSTVRTFFFVIFAVSFMPSIGTNTTNPPYKAQQKLAQWMAAYGDDAFTVPEVQEQLMDIMQMYNNSCTLLEQERLDLEWRTRELIAERRRLFLDEALFQSFLAGKYHDMLPLVFYRCFFTHPSTDRPVAFDPLRIWTLRRIM